MFSCRALSITAVPADCGQGSLARPEGRHRFPQLSAETAQLVFLRVHQHDARGVILLVPNEGFCIACKM